MNKKTINNVCIVNCFDTYEHRVDLLHDYFKSIGAKVRVITSDYRHFEKCKRNDSKEDFEFVEATPYIKNMSVTRLRSHRDLSKNIFKRIKHESFDLLWVLVPPNSFVKDAAKYKKTHKDTVLIFDLIDLWPETMPINKFKSLPPFQYWKGLRDHYLNAADKIVTECNLYHEKLPADMDKSKVQTIYLARKVKEFPPVFSLPENKMSLCYLGSINNIIDISAIKNIIVQIRTNMPVELHIMGDGEKREELIQDCTDAGAEVLFHGKVYDSAKKQKIFDSCHYGLNIMKKSVFVGLTMKSIDYFEAGLPVLNNIHGDTWDIVKEKGIGINIDETANICSEKYDFEMRKKARLFFEQELSNESFFINMNKLLGLE